MRAVLSIGSNMADRYALLRSAYDYFAADLVVASSIYATPPWGGVEQDEFLNAILIIDTELSPMELLAAAHEVEEAGERRREVRWGPRTLDVDIVQCLDDAVEQISTDPVLTLPHPYAHERAFVLVPWLEAAPQATLRGVPISECLAAISPDNVAEVRKVGEFS
ncbi:2-amino-4-hydroxy-6-hydroxymethyldihydropteridine diphosphokinase [Corynebacterium hindlerae]|uniref:2-amino-4-hydroxy-6-hydroxymethyldihydropteridine diphosphokinase n=1 Tax=Corynebacterium hindlerae TaxID=699041 RepID=A0A7G5FD92_9CORY|nr:2-amino-4-hydroxy-6-hydroxymethyldihydropteridine diphosphokinase [Corynebacterium hindlerae]QMV84583.1 2-amino-4-hydroxy-6-hydroxymethyldihydropteridine diphosphokinase [Corynebacterium hindlerae]